MQAASPTPETPRRREEALESPDAPRTGSGGTLDRIRNLAILLRGQLWLIPAIISAFLLALAYLLLEYGGVLLSPQNGTLWWLYSGDADSAREVLSSVLSGLITMTSLVVSVTFVILTLAANQLGPRLIMIFIADRQIQLVLGLFLGTILYVLMVLRTLDDELGKQAVPHVAISVGSALTVVCLFTLLFYIHKVARSIVADNVVRRVSIELSRHIRQILPEESPPGKGGLPSLPVLDRALPVALDRRGYIQTIDYSALVRVAREQDRVLAIEVRAGHFVLKHGRHLRVHPEEPMDETALAAIRDAFVIGDERTPAQDLEFGIRQLVEIALRALSPGINDTFTALAVMDRLAAALEEILSRPLQPVLLRDGDGAIRVIADRSDIEGLFDASFDLIRQAARGHPAILIRMADVLAQLGPVLTNADAREAALAHFEKLEETARQAGLASADNGEVMRRIDGGRASLEHEEGERPPQEG